MDEETFVSFVPSFVVYASLEPHWIPTGARRLEDPVRRR